MSDTTPLIISTTMISSLLLVLVIVFVLARSKTLELRLILIGVFAAIAAAVTGERLGSSASTPATSPCRSGSRWLADEGRGDSDPLRGHVRGAGPNRTRLPRLSRKRCRMGDKTGSSMLKSPGGDRGGRLRVFRGIPRATSPHSSRPWSASWG